MSLTGLSISSDDALAASVPDDGYSQPVAETSDKFPRVAYLTNVYPKISHSFIRTEIASLERVGFQVSRFTIRRTTDAPRNEDDRNEQARTVALLGANNWIGLIGGIARRFWARPYGTLAALRQVLSRPRTARNGVAQFVRSFAYFAEAAALADRLERNHIRHLHVHFGTNPVTVARLAALMSSISYSFTAHGPDEFDAPSSLDLAGKIANAAFVVGISSFGRGQLMRWSDPACWPNIHVVRCSVAPAFLSEPLPVSTPRRLVCVARLNAQKGLPLLLDAVARLRAQEAFRIDIIGDGEQRAAVETQIDRLGLHGRVNLLGWRTSAEVLDEISTARALVLPSFAEGLPVVLMEALALGRPAIATAVAGIPELIDSGNGWLIPSGSVEALAVALQAVLDAPDETLHAMGAIGQARVRAMHDPDKNARVLARLLDPLCQQPGPATP